MGVGGMATRHVLSVKVGVSNTPLPAKYHLVGWFPRTSIQPDTLFDSGRGKAGSTPAGVVFTT